MAKRTGGLNLFLSFSHGTRGAAEGVGRWGGKDEEEAYKMRSPSFPLLRGRYHAPFPNSFISDL